MIRYNFFYKTIIKAAFFSLFLSFFIPFTVFAWAVKQTDLNSDPKLIYGSLENQFKYVIVQNRRPKDRVSMHLYVKAGSLNETDTELGIAHFLEHLLFRGTENFAPGELVKYFQSIGMNFGPDANGQTSFDSTIYDLMLADSSKESLKKGLLIFRDYADRALLIDSEIKKELEVVLAEKRERDSVAYRTFVSQFQFMLPDTLIPKRLSIGEEETLRAAGHNTIKKFYDTWYRPENMILVMVGDFDTKEAALLIEKEFGSMVPRGPPANAADIGKINHKGIKTFYHFEKEAGAAKVSIYTVKEADYEKDSIDTRKKEALETLAAIIVQNRLDELLQNKDTPFTSASVSIGDRFLKKIEITGVSAACLAENWRQSLEKLEQTIRSAQTYGFLAQELMRAKKEFLAEIDDAVKKWPTADSRDIAEQIIDHISLDKVFMGPAGEKELLEPIISSASLQDVQNAFNKNWEVDHRLVIVTGNADIKGDKKEAELKILDAFNKSLKTEISKPDAGPKAVFPYLAPPKEKGEIASISKIEDLGIVQIDFANNVRLNLKKTDFEADRVLLSARFGGGVSCQPIDKPGLSMLSEELINESGLGAMDKKLLDRALAGENTSLYFVAQEDSFLFKGETNSNKIKLLLELLYAHLKDPCFRDQAFSLVKERFKQKYLKLKTSVRGAMLLEGSRLLASGDSRFGMPDYESFEKLNLKDVETWMLPFFNSEPIEVSIVGDFDEKAVINLASLYLGNIEYIKKTGSPKNYYRPVKFPEGLQKTIKVDTKIPKALVVVSFPTEDMWDIKLTRRLNIMAEVFSDRLRENIREQLGESYSPFAYNKPSRAYSGYGLLNAFVMADPQKTDAVIEQVKQTAAKLAKDGVSEQEIERAVNPVVTEIKERLRENIYWLDTVLCGSKDHPDQIKWAQTILDDHVSIDRKEILPLAKRYIDKGKAAVIVIKP